MRRLVTTRGIILPFLLLALSPFVIFDSDYVLILCPLCKSNTLWNIFMILGRNIEQNEDVSLTRMTTSVFLLLLSPLLEFDFVSALQHEYPSEYFDDIW